VTIDPANAANREHEPDISLQRTLDPRHDPNRVPADVEKAWPG
jgi:hypothetical protein